MANASWQHQLLHRNLLRLARRNVSGRATIQQRRARFERVASLAPMPRKVAVTQAALPDFPAQWLVPADSVPGRCLLYLHGGGYVMGSTASHRALAARIARAARARTLIIDYRLAPEHLFPSAVDDAVRACQWLRARQKDSHPLRLFIAGDSAGGGLAVATALSLRDAGTPLPAGLVCLSPWVDLTCTAGSIAENAAVDPIVPARFVRATAEAYLGGAPADTPLASPLFADLQGLPPLLIHVGTNEVLLDDSLRLTARARDAGVAVQLEVWPEMMHVWHFFAPFVPESRRAVRGVGAFVEDRMEF